MKIEAIKCTGCGRIGLSVDDTRITDHKCAGSWETVASAEHVPGEMRGSDAAHAAVKYLLDRIRTDPDLYYYCGVGTQVFHLLTIAEAERADRPLADVEAQRRKDLQPAHRRRESEVETLRRKLEEARG